MRSKAPTLLPILRSPQLAQLLAHIVTQPDREFGLTELADELNMPLTNVQREAQRLIETELVHTRKIGRTRLITVNTDNPSVRPLTELLSIAYGPRATIAEEFAQVPGAQRVLIFGSWAARFAGISGPPPNDIDVLVVGDTVSQMDTFEAADRAQHRLNTPVNPVQCTVAQWSDPQQDVLITQIQRAPFVEVFHAGEISS